MSTEIDVLEHRAAAYADAVTYLAGATQTVAAREAAIQTRTEFLADLPRLIADAIASYRRCQRLLARTMVDRLADKQITVRATIQSLADAGWLTSDEATSILATLPKPLDESAVKP